MKRYTYSCLGTFAFEVDAEDEAEARRKAYAILHRADSDGFIMQHGDALSPRFMTNGPPLLDETQEIKP